MEKAPIKKFAVEVRRKLIADVTFQLERYGITEKGIVEPQTSTDKELVFDLGNGNIQTIRGERAVNQYRNLVAHVRGFYTDDAPKKELEQFIEEVAYTWFDRLIAIRFMEVNRYLPVRVLSSEIDGQKLPDLVKSPFSSDLEFTDEEKQRIFDLQDANKEDDLFRFLFFKQCNDLSRILPRLFENLDGSNSFSELLVVLSFNDPNGAVYRLVHEVDERWFDIHAADADGKPMGQVQILGWMYQYYNADLKEQVFKDLKKNIKISKQNIPAATQLFTPDWIVRYMVENSLGHLWAEGHPDFDKSDWKYYLDEAPQEPQVEQQLKDIRAQYAKMEPEQLKVIDPCMGSGHILCYLFDVLMQIYLDNGYSKREAVRSILENNLFGLDIDKRAAQFAYFSVMMKAREYDSGFFDRKKPDGTYNIPQLYVYEISESSYTDKKGFHKNYNEDAVKAFSGDDKVLYHSMDGILRSLENAKEYGSLTQTFDLDWKKIFERFDEIQENTLYKSEIDQLKKLTTIAKILGQKYDVVVTNPPYMGASNMNPRLNEFIKQNYSDYKSDFFSAFVVRASQMLKPDGRCGFFTPYVWMFIQSYEKLRQYLYSQTTLETLIQFEYSAFEEATVPVCTFTFAKHHVNKKGNYLRLVDFRGGMEVQRQKTLEAIANHNCGFYYEQSTDNFAKIPGKPVAYWASEAILSAYTRGKLIGDIADVKIGMGTGKNDIFVREWWEIFYNQIDFSLQSIKDLEKSSGRYFPYNKGGEFRLWFGNLQEVLWFDKAGRDYMNTMSGHRENGGRDFYCKEGLTWSFISSSKFGIRYMPTGCFFDVAGSTLFSNKDSKYILGFLASCVCFEILSILNPTLNYQAGNIKSLPLLADRESEVDSLVEKNIDTSRTDWDAFETSWDFKRHPLV